MQDQSSTDFDVIVVGAGPAGSMAAWKLASLGRKVALVERGSQPGEKNLFGGMIYSLELARHFPDFLDSAPIERLVTKHSTHFLAGERSLNLDFSSSALAQGVPNGFTAYRSRFDPWLAAKASQAGADLIPSTLVTEIVRENGKVSGVKTHRDGGLLKAPLVILADGILSLLGQSEGLIPRQDPHHYSLGVREVLALPPGTIEDRFGIGPNGGCAALFVGSWPKGMKGGGFIYTNRETLSVGFVGQLSSLKEGKAGILECLEAFKENPAVRRLIQGGERLEYGAHVVPEGGWNMRPRLTGDGVMLVGDAAGLVLAAGVIYEGVHYAMHSGVLAAETAHQALEKGNVSKGGLSNYPKALGKSYVSQNLKTFRRVPALLTNSRMYHVLPEAVCQVAEDFFRAEATGHQKLLSLFFRRFRPHGLFKSIQDLWFSARAFFF